MQARLSLLLALALSLLLSACGSSSNSSRAVATPPAGNGNGTPVTAVITANFDPTNAVVPFPTNLLLSGTTDLTLNIPVADPGNYGDPKVAMNALDGFSTTAPWSTSFSAPPNPATIIGGPGGTVRVFEVTLTGPGGGVTSVVRELKSPQEFVAVLAPSDTTGRTLAIVPTHALQQLTSYMAILIGNGGQLNPAPQPSITDANGNDITPDTAYFLAKRTTPLCVNGQSTDPLLPTAQACALEPLRQLVNSQEYAVDQFDGASTDQRIVLSWVLTTQSITPEMQAVQSRVEQSPAPTAQVAPTGLNLGNLGVGLPPVADIYAGVLAVPYYLGAPSAADPLAPMHDFWHAAPGAYVPPFDSVGLSPASTNVTFANPFPVAASTQLIPVLLTVPNANSGHSRPAAGWPVVIFQHGITRNRTDMFAIAGTLAAQGFAVIAIDAPLHGLADPTNPFFDNQLFTGTPAAGLVTGERTFNLDLENNATGAPGPDGVFDPSGAYFINLSYLLTSRDNLRQATSDLMELTRAIPEMSFDGNPTGDFDGSRIEFVGQSLGSIIGTTFMAMEPHVNVGVLNVPGGGVAGLLEASPTFGPIINAGLAQAGLTPGTPNFAAFLTAAQTVVDSGDSINFAFATAGKAILAQEVVGDSTHPSDQVIPNSVPSAPLSGTEPLLAALGLSSITQTTQQAAPIRGVVRFTQGAHGSLLDPTSSPAVTAEMQGEMASMIASDGHVVLIANPSVIRTQ